MSSLQEFAFFLVLSIVALSALIFLLVVALAVKWTLEDHRHLRRRARELAEQPVPVSSEWEREVWVPPVVEAPAHVYRLSEWRKDGAA